jgi:hypothetical protein
VLPDEERAVVAQLPDGAVTGAQDVGPDAACGGDHLPFVPAVDWRKRQRPDVVAGHPAPPPVLATDVAEP